MTETRKRNVHFDSSLSAHIIGVPANSGSLDACWYVKPDYKRFRSDTVQEIASATEETINKDDTDFRQLVSSIYKACCAGADEVGTRIPTVREPTLTNDPTSWVENQDIVEGLLTVTNADGSSNRVNLSNWKVGLEVVSSREIQADSGMRRRQLWKIIKGIQHHARGNGLITPTFRDEAFFRGVERVSRPARLFASSVGKAVAESVVQSNSAPGP